MAPHPDRVPAVRVLVLGDSGCGKTTLCSLLASGPAAQPPGAPARTQGADVHVRLLSPGPSFVELLDLSGDAEAYGPLRPLLLGSAPAAGGASLPRRSAPLTRPQSSSATTSAAAAQPPACRAGRRRRARTAPGPSRPRRPRPALWPRACASWASPRPAWCWA